jgi:hypothetical protein
MVVGSSTAKSGLKYPFYLCGRKRTNYPQSAVIELGEDCQVRMKPNPIQPTDSEGE